MRFICHRVLPLALASTLVIIACDTTRIVDDDGQSWTSVWVSVAPQTALLDAIGATTQLATVDATSAPVRPYGLIWRAIEPGVISIDASGQVTAVAPGTARIVGEDGRRADTA